MVERIRGFEVVKKYEGKGIELPTRATKGSAGYDVKAAEDTVIPSIWKVLHANEGLTHLVEGRELPEGNKSFVNSTLVPTGLKTYMPENEYVLLANRSSNPMKKQLALPNGIGVIDSDYYNNDGNEGELFCQLINYGFEDYTVKKGDRIAQAIFMSYSVIDEEVESFETRIGGFGSSGE